LIERLRAAAEAAKEEEETAHTEVETARPERKPAPRPATFPDVPVPFPRRSPARRDAPGSDEPPSLPPALIERLRAAAEAAREEETADAEVETARPERRPPPRPATFPDVPVPFPRRSPARRDAPGPDQENEAAERPTSVPERILSDDPTAPVPVISEAMHRDPVDSGAADIAAPQDARVQQDPPVPHDARAPQNGTTQQNGTTHRLAPGQQDDARQNGTTHREAPRQQNGALHDAPAPQNGTLPQNGIAHQPAPGQQDDALQNGITHREAPRQQNGTAPRNRPVQLDPPARQWEDPGTRERAGRRAGGAGPAREVWPQDQRPSRRPTVGRRLQITGVVVAVLTLTAAGALTMALSGHTGSTPVPAGRRASAGKAEEVTRDLAAAWVAQQVSRTAVVSCDPIMCGALKSHGVPANGLDWIEPSTTSPLASAVIVATAAVRAQFGNLLSSVYAPGVIARFGSGQIQIDIREVAPHGAAAYRSALHADLMDRKASGAGLLGSGRIVTSATARRQLITGQVDSRLIVMMAGLAAVHPIDIVAFGNVAPGGDLTMPLRFAEVTQPGPGHPAVSRSASPAFVRSIVAFVRGQPAGLGVAQTQTVRLPGGLTVLRIQFGAPSPLGLLGPH